ncbi:GTPase-associated system all-helical protein GASH [Sphingomonas cavernae]|uniref:GTPase-associated system helical domain-containing protein n=1 Tax=Sphingomonas cavernae TaxID=2320861 RepID=A0A418W7Y5_9SPHN|nr:GTPase-associated system all-helical protein GASH [Sphingomonas cavernae]RJF86113.1 hypothetical protein D3876_20065 [Sphingomonas cavernae]
MSGNIGAWYRGAAIGKDEERLTHRRTASVTLAASIEKMAARDVAGVAAYGLGILTGSGAPSPYAATIIERMQGPQPSLSEEDAAAEGDARICTLAAIEKMIEDRAAKPNRLMRKEPAIVAAEAIVCATRMRVVSAGSNLAGKLGELISSAETLLTQLDAGRRTRRVVKPTLTTLKGAADLEGVKAEAAKAIEGIWLDSHLDREELQALWWVFSGFSPTLLQGYETLTKAKAAVASGIDLAGLLEWPGTKAFAELATRASGANLHAPDAAPENGALSALTDDDLTPLTHGSSTDEFPDLNVLIPLTAASFVRSTGADSSNALAGMRQDLSYADLARQSFAECSLLTVVRG